MSTPSPALNRVSIPRTDQRSHQRYPIVLDLEYEFMDGGQVQRAGYGRTLNISNGGVLFELTKDVPDNIPQPSGAVELTIGWQFVLQEICALRLRVRGRVVRTEFRRFAIELEQREFWAAKVETLR